jgi:hypothetical protein
MARRRQNNQMLLVPLLDVDALYREFIELRDWTGERINADARHLTNEIARLTEEKDKLDKKREKIVAQIDKQTALRETLNDRLPGGRKYMEAAIKQMGSMASPRLVFMAMDERFPSVRRGRGRPRVMIATKGASSPEPEPAAVSRASGDSDLDARLVDHLDEEGKSDRDLAKELEVPVKALRASVKRVQSSNPDVIRTPQGLVALRPHAAS